MDELDLATYVELARESIHMIMDHATEAGDSSRHRFLVNAVFELLLQRAVEALTDASSAEV